MSNMKSVASFIHILDLRILRTTSYTQQRKLHESITPFHETKNKKSTPEVQGTGVAKTETKKRLTVHIKSPVSKYETDLEVFTLKRKRMINQKRR